MAMTKERKILMAAAGVACAVFLGDRVLLGGTMGGPQSAQAASGALALPSDPGDSIPETAPEPTPAPVGSQPTRSVASLAERLDRARDILPTETRDVFRPSDAWQAAPEPTPTVYAEPTFDARDWVRRHPLDAVYSTNGAAHAVVAGQIVRLGESRDGLTLTQVGDRWVVWRGHGREFKVHLDPPR